MPELRRFAPNVPIVLVGTKLGEFCFFFQIFFVFGICFEFLLAYTLLHGGVLKISGMIRDTSRITPMSLPLRRYICVISLLVLF